MANSSLMLFLRMALCGLLLNITGHVKAQLSVDNHHNLDIKSVGQETTRPVSRLSVGRAALGGLIQVYQQYISSQYISNCQFTPSCSHFGHSVISQGGILRGLLLTSDRLQRCHPLAEGYDFQYFHAGPIDDPVEVYLNLSSNPSYSPVLQRYPAHLAALGASFTQRSDSIIHGLRQRETLGFADHLFLEKDYIRAAKQYQQHLRTRSAGTDTLAYQIALSYRLGNDTTQALDHLQRFIVEYPESPLLPRFQYDYSLILFEQGRHEESVVEIMKAMNQQDNRSDLFRLNLLLTYNYIWQHKWSFAATALDSMPVYALTTENLNRISSLSQHTGEWPNIKRKNPFLAATLSAVFPGAGKMYCHRYADGFNAFMLTSILTLLTMLDYNQDDRLSTSGILTGLGTVFYYLGNVYGSFLATQIFNKQEEGKFVQFFRTRIDLLYPD